MKEHHEYQFKGVWIVKELWLTKDLSWMEKCLVADIDNLSGDEGCTASDKYFAEKFQSSSASIANMLCKLRKLGYLKTEAFNGRTRTMRVNPRVKAGLTPLLKQDKPPSESRSNPAVSSLIREEKDERKESKNGSKAIATHNEIRDFCADNDVLPSDADYFFNHWEGNGWTNGGKKMKCWKSTIRAWKSAGHLPSQKKTQGGKPKDSMFSTR